MSGCFGTHQEDRARERELNAHLEKAYGDADRLDAEVAKRTETIFNDINEFESFMYDGHEAGRLIIRELLRALFIQRYSKVSTYPNKCTDAVYAFDALSNCNEALDAKIRQIVENEQ